MAKERRMMDYGYEPEELAEKGTLFVLDAFAEIEQEEVENVLRLAEERRFTKVVFFPHSEKTLKTMFRGEIPPFHKRVKMLEAILEDIRTPVACHIDNWEEKRKKYTPMELVLRYFEEKYKPPFFFYVSDAYANVFSTFASFDEIMRKVRLLIEPKYNVPPSAKLTAQQKRWDYV